jgi:hypothetical protein
MWEGGCTLSWDLQVLHSGPRGGGGGTISVISDSGIMPRCEFGTPDKVSPDASEVLSKVDPRLRQTWMVYGLHDVSALDPPDSFVVALVSHCAVKTEDDFCFLDARWPEQAMEARLPHPPTSSIAAFIANLGGVLKWVNSADVNQHTDDVKQLSARVMRAWRECRKTSEDTSVGKPEGEDMDVRTNDTMSSAYEAMYGSPVVVSGLAQSSICNSLHRQLSTGLNVDDLKSMISRDTPRRGKAKLEFDMDSGKSTTTNSFSKGISSTGDFMARLKTFMNTLTFVSSMHVAPADRWEGKASVGVVRGTRYQFSRAGAEFYLDFWSRQADKFRSDVGALVDLELRMRSTWVDKFGTERMSLESAMRESVLEKGHAADAWSPKRPREWEGGEEWSGKGKGKGGRGKGADAGGKGKGGWRDVSQLPGFRQGCRPFTGLHNGKRFCPHFNRGTTCWHGAASCDKWHRCDTTKPDGTPCDADHSRQQHPLT